VRNHSVAAYCGTDWAEGHHDIALVDDDGKLVAKRRINESVEGFAELVAMFADFGDSMEALIPVAIEAPRELLVAALRAAGRQIYPTNPLAVARYREARATTRTPRSLTGKPRREAPHDWGATTPATVSPGGGVSIESVARGELQFAVDRPRGGQDTA
jgi:hypothetical protein